MAIPPIEDSLPEGLDDPALQEVIRAISVERARAAEDRLGGRPKALSRSTTLVGRTIQRVRYILTIAALVLAVASIATLPAHPGTGALLPAALAVLAGGSLAATLIAEIFSGAGLQTETQFREPEGYRRSYYFYPSPSVRTLLLVVALVPLTLVSGFAGLYSAISSRFPTAFSADVSSWSSLYFSGVTFATVSFGDIVPRSWFARALTLSEIVASFFCVVVVLATIVSWAMANHQSRMEISASNRARDVEWRERVMREAKLGLYGDLHEMVAAAKSRMAEQATSETN